MRMSFGKTKKVLCGVTVPFLFLLLGGCAASLKDYRARTPAEAGVQALLLEAEAAWNRQDAAGFAVLLDRHATFSLEEGGRVVGREAFVRNLPRQMKAQRWDLGPPKITFRAAKAFAILSLKTAPGKTKLFFTLHRRGNRWRILAVRAIR